MIKVKLKKIIDDSDSLAELLKIDFPIKVSYWLNRILDKIRSELIIYEKTRKELVMKLGEQKDSEKDDWQVTDANEKEFYSEIEKLQDEEIELDFNPIKIDTLGDIKIKPELLVSWIFEE